MGHFGTSALKCTTSSSAKARPVGLRDRCGKRNLELPELDTNGRVRHDPLASSPRRRLEPRKLLVQP